MKKQIGFFKTTAIGGLIFLLPLMVIGFFVAQLVQIIQSIVVSLRELLKDDVLEGYEFVYTPAGIAILTLVAVAILIGICFAAGIIARRTIGKRFSGQLEKYLTMFFPRYTIIKAQMSRSMDEEKAKEQLIPVVVRLDDFSRVAFEIQRNDNGVVTIYVPGSPDPWAGSVIHVNADRVKRLDVDVSAALSSFENLGRDTDDVFVDLSESDTTNKHDVRG